MYINQRQWSSTALGTLRGRRCAHYMASMQAADIQFVITWEKHLWFTIEGKGITTGEERRNVSAQRMKDKAVMLQDMVTQWQQRRGERWPSPKECHIIFLGYGTWSSVVGANYVIFVKFCMNQWALASIETDKFDRTDSVSWVIRISGLMGLN